MRKTLLILLGLMLICPSAHAFDVWAVNSLTGGGSGALDALDKNAAGSPNNYNVDDGDVAIYTYISGTSPKFSIYVYDADGTDAESTVEPYEVIRPDDYATASPTNQGNWRLTPLSTKEIIVAPATDPGWTFSDSDAEGAAAADKVAAHIKANMETTTEDSEDVDLWFIVMQGGSEVTVLRFDESDDQWETSKVINSSGGFTGDLTGNADTATNLAAATLVTEGEGIGSNDNDTTVPTSAAVKDYADSNDDTGSDDQNASEVSIADGGDIITATDVEGALQELTLIHI